MTRMKNRQSLIVFYCYKFLTTFISCFSLTSLWGLAKFAAVLNLYVIKYRNDVVFNQFQHHLGYKKQEKNSVLLIFYTRQFFIFLDMMKTWHLNKKNLHVRLNKFIKKYDNRNFDLKSSKGMVIASHLSNFIYGCRVVNHYFHPFSAIIREQKNKKIHDDYYQCLTKDGFTLLDFRKDLKKIFYFQIPKEHWLGLLVDQDAGKKGVYVPFMKEKASTFPGTALLLKKYKMPAYMAFMKLDNNLNYTLFLEKFYPEYSSSVEEITENINQKIGDFIYKYPYEWFWFHRRWKTKM